MFLSSDKNVAKKKFQEPNILRRKPKWPTKTVDVHESLVPSAKTLVTATLTQEPKLQLDDVTKTKYVNASPNKHFQTSTAIEATDVFRIVTNDDIDSIAVSESVMITNNNEERFTQCPVNVESFLNVSTTETNPKQSEIDEEVNSIVQQDWALDFTENTHEYIIENMDGSQLGRFHVQQGLSCVEPISTVLSGNTEQAITASRAEIIDTPAQIMTQDYFDNSTMKFKCEIHDCKKRFRTEKSLSKHRNTHNPQNGTKVAKQTSFECPVRTENEEGSKPCGMEFATKPDLMKHLGEEHDPEDANYICSVCSKRFFWAAGLRLHARAHGARCALACAWPGCGRVFRQPCRLREHQRSHNGDKPYPCRFGGCSWSFRSASKLARHLRRHTGERRHACGACDRAFPRREHLRDHIARHHAPTQSMLCLVPDCKRTFPNMEMRSNHMRRVHKGYNAAVQVKGTPPTFDLDRKETYMLYLNSPLPAVPQEVGVSMGAELTMTSNADSSIAVEEEACEWHSARTHCTWPLAPRQTTDNVSFVEEDVQVELSEGSESSTYTIRSDLFLHGNVLNNDDSQHMVGGGGAATDAALGLLDAHPTIDLMQEDLMYTDSAVDESSFRVFLLSGEELT